MKPFTNAVRRAIKRKGMKPKPPKGMNAEGKHDWEVMMSVINPVVGDFGSGRPRRTSVHTIAAVVGRDALTILEEMKASGKVVGYVCPDVRTPIFYLSELSGLPNMIDTRNEQCWDAARQKIKDFPPEKVKGFKRFAGGSDANYAMDVPYEAADKPYHDAILAALKAAGF